MKKEKDIEYYKKKYKKIYWQITIFFLIIIFVQLYDLVRG